MSEKTYDAVEKPKGYNQGSIQCADYIADQKLNYFEGNAVKYIVRHKHKNGLEDLKKAKWYLEYLIAHYGEIFSERVEECPEKELSSQEALASSARIQSGIYWKKPIGK